MLELIIPNHGNFILDFDEACPERFSFCKLLYENESLKLNVGEDYLYVYIECILYQIRNHFVITSEKVFGEMGKWQEYYYYDDEYNIGHAKEIDDMKKSILFSESHFACFLYQYKESIWLEFNQGYEEQNMIDAYEFYSNPQNYRILFTEITDEVLKEWESRLQAINELIRIR
ncbi:MAG: hypothetical protein J6K04_08265 [Lachnospiraceae bacterium]|nr:hypothetical protein [Lachnospiraceae bacterium]